MAYRFKKGIRAAAALLAALVMLTAFPAQAWAEKEPSDLLEAAFEMDDPDYAIELMTAEDERSWLGMMRDGATMAMEAWNQEVKPNQDWNHAWSTAPLNIAMRKILGVEPIEPGYASVRIRPQLGSLAFANGKMPTVRGAIAVNCSRDALAVVIPRGIRAEVVLPWNGETRNVGDGRHVFSASDVPTRQSELRGEPARAFSAP